MKDRIKKLIPIIFIIFLGAHVFSSLMKQDNNSFTKILEESFTRTPIDQVIVSNELLYVCYDDVQIVNVYDLTGKFLWSIDAPYMRNCRFQLLDGMLVVYHYSTELAYTYHAQTGEYLGVVTANKLDLSYKYPGEHTPIKELAPGEIGWDAFNVYRMDDGGLTKLVGRPWWYYLSHPVLIWAVGFFSALTCFTIIVIKKFRHKEDMDFETLPASVRKKAVFFKGFTFACIANILLNILILPFYPLYILSSFVLGAVLILWSITNAIYHLIVKRDFLIPEKEHPYAEKWFMAGFLAIFISVLSAAAVLMLTN